MPHDVTAARASFRALHQSGCFVLPNPWDVGSARMLAHLGFSALASTSAGYAWTIGLPDNQVTRDGVLEHLAQLCRATDLPVNADYESGFAEEPEGVAANVRLAIDTGVAGLSIEDRDGTPTGLYDIAFATERIRAARRAIDDSGQNVILVARTEGLLVDPSALTPAIDKLVAFAQAGADCLYAPGVMAKADIVAMVRAVAPKPVNVVISKPGTRVADFAEMGVRRISIGGALARAAWAGALDAARTLREGSFDGFAGATPSRELNGMFAPFA
ncbi:isocitrate lyase/PEP mutase family protein [Caenimonas aquaedulcis]|uniref:Isocitrate lyase/phosphoenolpyruvate mutase family protein n=1 Tax=Caenimonas aquaedulcis TaxID=2793270 RepID=A0A931MGZ2_9BURK|nr:isocitrate lyase/phosphoenolpyruvate mutase family protein [Caenimonas aquaedulcis]MBG9388428.1 isocitrate lyase/phosphoenolpyruvate mutase family protein [Caenimonas aquaedulcis]